MNTYTPSPLGSETQTVKDLRMAALWYAWGQQDAGIGTEVDAWQFGIHYRDLAERYELGFVGSRPSVRDAWESYQAGDPFASALADAIERRYHAL